MQCKRLLNLTKSWYISVKDEAMAPARMIQFMKNHAANCDVCAGDPDLKDEINRITELILPESKIPKAVRLQQEEDSEEEEEESSDDETDDADNAGDDTDDKYIEEDDEEKEEDLLDRDSGDES